jgi:hypothetical protein
MFYEMPAERHFHLILITQWKSGTLQLGTD